MPIIQVNMLEGRSTAEKRALVAALTDAVVESLRADPQSVRIMIHELAAEHYALAGTTAGDQPLAQRRGRNGTSALAGANE